jgi:hypothetical protein
MPHGGPAQARPGKGHRVSHAPADARVRPDWVIVRAAGRKLQPRWRLLGRQQRYVGTGALEKQKASYRSGSIYKDFSPTNGDSTITPHSTCTAQNYRST